MINVLNNSKSLENMSKAFRNCTNLTGSPICGPNVINMYQTYANCYNIQGCGYFYSNKVNNAYDCFQGRNPSNRLDLYIYQNGPNATYNTMKTFVNNSSIVMTNDLNARGLYYNTIHNIYIHSVGGNSTTNDMNIAKKEKDAVLRYVMTSSSGNLPVFNSSYNYTTSQRYVPVYGTVTGIYSNTVFSSVNFCNNQNLKGIANINTINLTDMHKVVYNCSNFVRGTFCGNSVVNMNQAFAYCYNLKDNPVCGPLVTDFQSAYYDCKNLNGYAVCGNNVINMAGTYYSCSNLTGSPVCKNNVTNMHQAYWSCVNLTGSPVCGPNVTSMASTYAHCKNIIGNPVCGPNVTTMSWTYYNCWNLTGSPVCGNNVINMYCTYDNCYNLTGTAVCGPNVTNMNYTYYNCSNLTGNPVVGNNVTDMNYTYYGCSNLTGTAVCGNRVTNMYYTYYGCSNLSAGIISEKTNNTFKTYANTSLNNLYVYNVSFASNNIFLVDNKSNSKRLNVYAKDHTGSMYLNLTRHNNSFVNGPITWTKATQDHEFYRNYMYNAGYNIYIYFTPSVYHSQDTIENKRNYYPIVIYNCTNNASNLVPFLDGVAGNTNNLSYNIIGEYSSYKEFIYATEEKTNISNIRFDYSTSREVLCQVPYISSTITNLHDSFRGCHSLSHVSYGNAVTDISQAFTFTAIRNAFCGPNVTNMYLAYYNCDYLLNADCGPNVINMRQAYSGCTSLRNNVACGPNVIDMVDTYYNCYNLTGSPACGNNVTNMYQTYYNCRNLTGSPVCGPNVTDMSRTYYNCYNLTGSPICGDNVTNMYNAYYNCSNLTGTAACGNNVIDMCNAYINCVGLTTPACGPNVTNMNCAYWKCSNLTTAVCGPNVTNMYYAYSGCKNIKTAVCGDLVTNFGYAYMGCSNLTTAVCGPNVFNMYHTYGDCTNLTTAVCGINTQYMNYTYIRCYNLKEVAYSPKAWEMEGTYKYCTNLETACLYEQAYNVKNTFEGCISLTKCFVLSTRLNNVHRCFADTNTSKRLDIYVTKNTTSSNKLLNTSSSYSITGSTMTWTNDVVTNGCYYNTAYNIYIYPVADVNAVMKLGKVTALYTAKNQITPVFNTGYQYNYNATLLSNNAYSIEITPKTEGDFPSIISFRDQSDLLTVSLLDTRNVTNMDYMFANCSKLNTAIDMALWDLSKVTSASHTFDGCTSIK